MMGISEQRYGDGSTGGYTHTHTSLPCFITAIVAAVGRCVCFSSISQSRWVRTGAGEVKVHAWIQGFKTLFGLFLTKFVGFSFASSPDVTHIL